MAIKAGDEITAQDVNDAFDLKADKDHIHSIEDIDGLQLYIGDINSLELNINNALELKADKNHIHMIEDINGDLITTQNMNNVLALKADKTHTHSIEEVDNLQLNINNALNLKEDKANKKTTLTNSNTDYPTTKLLETELNKKQNTLSTSTGISISSNTVSINTASNITINGKWNVPTPAMPS